MKNTSQQGQVSSKQTPQQHPRVLSYEEYQEKLQGIESADDALAALRDIFAPTIQDLLEAELTGHLGYEKHEKKSEGDERENARNGYSKKTLKSHLGESEILVPRDRNGTFEPRIVKKHQVNTNELEEKVIAMYAKGLTTRDINAHLGDIYGVSISASQVSQITDKIVPRIQEWQTRPLDSHYPFLFLDGIRFRVKDAGKIETKTAYAALGITVEGRKEVVGIWVGPSESAKFWMQVLNEMKERGVEDVLICATDDLTGFSEAIEAIFPKTQIQKCIVHQIRNTMKFVSHKDRKDLCKDLRTIYTASSEDAGFEALAQVQEKWPDYRAQLKKWEEKWTELSTFFQFPQEIRTIMYTTNAIESLNRQFRKITKTTSVFPHDESLLKLLYLAQEDVARGWSTPITNWSKIMCQLHILYGDRVSLS